MNWSFPQHERKPQCLAAVVAPSLATNMPSLATDMPSLGTDMTWTWCDNLHVTSCNCVQASLQDRAVRHANYPCQIPYVGSGGHVVERRTVNRGDSGSMPPTGISKLRQFHWPHICLCLSEETLKAGGPLYLMSMLGEIKDPTQRVVDSLILEKDNSCVSPRLGCLEETTWDAKYRVSQV